MLALKDQKNYREMCVTFEPGIWLLTAQNSLILDNSKTITINFLKILSERLGPGAFNPIIYGNYLKSYWQNKKKGLIFDQINPIIIASLHTSEVSN